MAVDLAPQGIRFVGKVAKPNHEELSPEKIQPQQHKGADQHAELANLVGPELELCYRESAKHGWDRHHGSRPCKQVAEPEVNRKHGAVPVWDKHHGEIPGKKGVAKHEADNHQWRHQIKLAFDFTMVDIARVQCPRQVRPEALQDIDPTQAVEQQQAKEVPDQQPVAV